jgi:hypothetical protein
MINCEWGLKLQFWIIQEYWVNVTWKLIFVCRIWRDRSVLSVSIPYHLRALQELAWLLYLKWDAIPTPMMSLHWGFLMHASLYGPLLLLAYISHQSAVSPHPPLPPFLFKTTCTHIFQPLKMEAACASETLVSLPTITWWNNPRPKLTSRTSICEHLKSVIVCPCDSDMAISPGLVSVVTCGVVWNALAVEKEIWMYLLIIHSFLTDCCAEMPN